MATLSPDDIQVLLGPYLMQQRSQLPQGLFVHLSLYLDLLCKWNAKTNLTAIRRPAEVVTRHFGESVFAATLIPTHVRTVLDLGSGAGFPGVPLQLLRPDLLVTLSESQGKKVAFLREVIRSLQLPTRIHAGRAEQLRGVQSFDLVTLRSVDKTALALPLALSLVNSQGKVLHLTTSGESGTPIPSTDHRKVVLY